MSAKGVVVIDPGHGGTTSVGGSSSNNATSASGVKEKKMTLQMAKLVKKYLKESAPKIKTTLSRSKDENLGLKARANVAKEKKANLFLSIHYNGFDGKVRGVETLIRPQADGNVNYDEDKAFAKNIQSAVFTAIKAEDPKTKNRKVKDQKLGVLRDPSLGNTAKIHPCRACLVEIEFIDVPAVDKLLNTNANAAKVREKIAKAIGKAIIKELS